MAERTSTGLHLSGTHLRQVTLRDVAGRIELTAMEERLFSDTTGAATGVLGHDGRAASAEAIVVAALPACDVITRIWSLPRTDPDRLRQMVAHRLEADLPIPVEQLTWDCRASLQNSTAAPTASVRMQAARHDRVARHLARLERGGRMVDMLTTEADGLAALCRYGLRQRLDNGMQALLLAMGDAWIMAVFNEGAVRAVHHIPLATDSLAVACQECRQSIESQGPVASLKRLIWLGGDDQEAAVAVLQERLGVPAERAEPAISLARPEPGPLDPGEFARCAIAAGLAMAGLREPDEIVRLGGRQREQAEPRHKYLEWVTAHPVRWGVAAVGFAVLALVVHFWALRVENRRMEALLAGYDRAESPMADLEPKIRAMGRINTYRIDAEAIVAHLCARIPNGITLSSIQLTRERGLSVKGTAGDLKDVFKWAEDLRQSRFFSNVQPGRTEPGRGGAFTLTADVPVIEVITAARGRGAR